MGEPSKMKVYSSTPNTEQEFFQKAAEMPSSPPATFQTPPAADNDLKAIRRDVHFISTVLGVFVVLFVLSVGVYAYQSVATAREMREQQQIRNAEQYNEIKERLDREIGITR